MLCSMCEWDGFGPEKQACYMPKLPLHKISLPPPHIWEDVSGRITQNMGGLCQDGWRSGMHNHIGVISELADFCLKMC